MLFFHALLFFLLPTFVVAAPGRSGPANGKSVEKKEVPLSDQVAYLVGGSWTREDYFVSEVFLT